MNVNFTFESPRSNTPSSKSITSHNDGNRVIQTVVLTGIAVADGSDLKENHTFGKEHMTMVSL